MPKTISRTIHMYSCSRFPLLPHCSFRTTFTLYVCFEVLLSNQRLDIFFPCMDVVYSWKCLLTSMEPTNISQVSFKSTFNRNMAKYGVFFSFVRTMAFCSWAWMARPYNVESTQPFPNFESLWKKNNNSSYEEKTLHFTLRAKLFF